MFTARYGLIAYIKQVYNRSGKCLHRGTDRLLIENRFLTMVEIVYSAIWIYCLYKADL
jgi:hypothetical protein